MRAFEITLLLICCIASIPLFSIMGVLPSTNTCPGATTNQSVLGSQVVSYLYNFANVTDVQQVTQNDVSAITLVTISVNYLIWGLAHGLMVLGLIVILAPTLQTIFCLPADFANYIMIGYWFLVMIALIQWLSGRYLKLIR